jgi:hypothetical protein
MSIVDGCVLLVCSRAVGHVWHAPDRMEETGRGALPGRCSPDIDAPVAGRGVAPLGFRGGDNDWAKLRDDAGLLILGIRAESL